MSVAQWREPLGKVLELLPGLGHGGPPRSTLPRWRACFNRGARSSPSVVATTLSGAGPGYTRWRDPDVSLAWSRGRFRRFSTSSSSGATTVDLPEPSLPGRLSRLSEVTRTARGSKFLRGYPSNRGGAPIRVVHHMVFRVLALIRVCERGPARTWAGVVHHAPAGGHGAIAHWGSARRRARPPVRHPGAR